MSQPSFSIEDILRELTVGEQSGIEGASTAEIAQRSGRPISWVMDKIRAAVRAGKVEYAGRRPTTRIDGAPCYIPVYRVVKKVEGEE